MSGAPAWWVVLSLGACGLLQPGPDRVDVLVDEQRSALSHGLLALIGGGVDDETLARLLDDPRVPDLNEVRLPSNQLGVQGAGLLGRHGKLTGLERASLSNNPLTDAGLRALAEGPNVAALRELDVSGVGATGDGIAALLASAVALQRVDVGGQPVGHDGAVALSARFGLLGISAEDATIGGPGATALLGSSAQRVSLAHNALGGGALSGLRAFGPRLETVDLSHTGLGPSDAAILAAVDPRVLKILDLSHNPLGDEGARALAASSLVRVLRILDLTGVSLGPEAAAELVEAWGDRPGLSLTN